MYTKIVAHNKKRSFKSSGRNEETRRAKKKEEKKTRSTEAKQKEQEEQVKQAQVRKSLLKDTLKKLMKTLNWTSIYKTQDLAGQLLL